MIELHSTWNWVVMLLVAGGIGMLGGVGAAFIEWRQRCAASNAVVAPLTCSPWRSALSCIVLGGIAAVAILYFFPPTKQVLEPVGGEEVKETTFYNLVELVALALIVGSAGATFLQALQVRTLALAKAQEAQAEAAAATTANANLPRQAEEVTEAQVKAASTELKAKLQEHPSLAPDQADELVNELADKASTAVRQNLETQARSNQAMIAAAAGGRARTLRSDPELPASP